MMKKRVKKIRTTPCKLSKIPSTKGAQTRHRRVLKSLGGVR